jgi:putative peptidoglycan lipid II flippase
LISKANSKPIQTLAHATLIIAFFSLLSKIVGLVRLNVLTAEFHAGQTLDVFYAAFRVPDFIFNLLILGTLSAAFVPVFCDYLVKSKEQAWEIASTIFNLTLVVMGLLSVALIVFAPIFVSLVVPGFSPDKQVDVVLLTRIMALSPLLFSLSSIFSSVLNSFKKFTVVALVPIVYNLSIIFGALVLYPRMGLSGLGWGVVMGAALHMIIQLPSAMVAGFRWRIASWNINLPGVRRIITLYIPRIFGMDASQISLLISTIVGSGLAAGTVTYYNLAYDLQTLPLSIIAVSFAVVAFPLLSDSFARADRQTFKEVFNINLSQILYLMIPISALMLILRAQLVRLAFGRGEFGWEATVLTLSTFGFFTVSLFAQSLLPLFSRAFYAMHNTVIPVGIGLVSAGANIALAIALTRYYGLGVEGLAIAFSASVILNLLLLFIFLEIKFGNLVDFDLVYKILKITVATIAMGIAAYGTLFGVDPFLDTRTVVGLLLQTASAGIVGAATYFVVGFFLKIPESRHFITAGRNWLSKLRTAFVRFPGV